MAIRRNGLETNDSTLEVLEDRLSGRNPSFFTFELMKILQRALPAKKYLYFATAFISGFVVLSLEMLGFRFLAPYFGYSTYVWGGLLGVIMAALSLGYYFGGRLADKRPEPGWVFNLVLVSAISLALVLYSYKTILSILANTGIVFGSIMGTLFLFGFPMVFLGMVSPFLIRLLAHEETIGMTAGNIFAVSTWGSLLGTFVTSFVLIPQYGSRSTLLLLILLLASLYIAGTFQQRKKLLIGLMLILFAMFAPGYESESSIVFETESAYNLIQVKKEEEHYALHLNDRRWTHSKYNKGFMSTGGYYDFMLLGGILTPCRDVLILGAGAGTSIRQFAHFFPHSNLDAVEIDPKIVQVGRKYFDWPDLSRVRIFVEDARPFLKHQSRLYDVIELDAFSGGPFLPFYLATQEFFKLVSNRLSPGGVFIMNVFTSGGDRNFSDVLGKTVRQVFPSLFALPLKDNILFIASQEVLSLRQLKNKLEPHSKSSLSIIVQFTLENIELFRVGESLDIFTDDKSPTEKMIYDMIKEKYQNQSESNR